MKDFLNNELAIGDYIAFTESGYRNLLEGVIIKFTPKKALIAFNRSISYPYNFEHIDATGRRWNSSRLIESPYLVKLSK